MAPSESAPENIADVPPPIQHPALSSDFLPDDVEERRKRVVALRLRNMTETAIAAIVGVSQQTVSNDLAYIRDHGRELYGPKPSLNVADWITNQLAFYEDCAQTALMESGRLGLLVSQLTQDPSQAEAETEDADPHVQTVPMNRRRGRSINEKQLALQAVRMRMATLRTAAKMREMQANLLLDLGLLDMRGARAAMELPRPEAIRAAIAQVRAMHPNDVSLMSETELRWKGQLDPTLGAPEKRDADTGHEAQVEIGQAVSGSCSDVS